MTLVLLAISAELVRSRRSAIELGITSSSGAGSGLSFASEGPHDPHARRGGGE